MDERGAIRPKEREQQLSLGLLSLFCQTLQLCKFTQRFRTERLRRDADTILPHRLTSEFGKLC